MIHIAPSILSADFSRLGEEVQAVERGGANRLHIDVMDGHFVPNLSMGPAIVESLRKRTRLPMEVHLMVTDAARFVEAFDKAGADSLIFHIEVVPEPSPLLKTIKQMGRKAGLAISPDTSLEAVEPYLADIDLALCMTVHPGFAAQKFIAGSPDRIRRLRHMITERQARCELEVDGGIDLQTGSQSVTAGANVLVAASSIFRHPLGPETAVRAFRRLFGQ